MRLSRALAVLVAVLVLANIAMITTAVLLLSVSLPVRFFGDGLSPHTQTVIIFVGMVIGAALCGWSANAVLGPLVGRLLGSGRPR
ncbi:hypothetical protein ABZ671_01355 [Micromonospora sp. NPDC006766]|uniref:hypothetical protein n=1 Tax=Micromonospora sp. NPDC006766 TaxID=3154778 RepID=UPI0033C063AB